ncbi:hypothetical protein [Rheinheimera sp.]|uniref:hypothetical protein n=1 Tax=Rheinheimera sp. TaxID=1869214 RepID=UPI00307E33A4
MKFVPSLRQFLASLGLLSAALYCSTASAYSDYSLANGDVRVHLPASGSASCDVIILAVGTAMSTSSYDALSSAITDYGYPTVIIDHNVGGLTKTDATTYAALVTQVKTHMPDWAASKCSAIGHYIVGGHSAGGQAAHYAMAADPTLADALFSVDPYNISGAPAINHPYMVWGFTVTTCFVTKEDAAEAAYNKSTGKRAFYRVNATYSWGPCGYSPKYFHCSFCDGHCPACTNCQLTPPSFFVDVATSVNAFVQSAFYGTWSKTALNISTATPLTLYVDSDSL